MIANGSMKLALVPLLIVAATWSSPSRLAQIRANRLTLTPVLGSSQSGIEPKVIEQRDFSGKVVARLRIMPGASAGEFQFEVEDFKQPIPARAVGSGKISDTEVRVRIVERASGTQLGLRAVVNGGRSPETRITLSLDRLSFHFIVDEKVRVLVSELQRLIAGGGNDAELIALARKLDHALQITTGYRPFAEQVRSSAAFDILTTTRSLMAMVSGEERARNLPLIVIGSTVRLLAPWPMRSGTVSQKTIRGDLILRVGLRENLVYPSLNNSPQSRPVQPPCIIQYQDCMNVNNCGGHGQPIDALCWLACAALYVTCEIIT